MMTVRGTRWRSHLSLEEQGQEGPVSPGGEPVIFGLAEGVRLGRSACSERLFYRSGAVYGLRLPQALAAGWCWFEEAADGQEAAAQQ